MTFWDFHYYHSKHYCPWRSKRKSIFDAEEEDAPWVLGVETEDTLIALSPVSFSCVVDVDLLLVETSYSVCSMLFV